MHTEWQSQLFSSLKKNTSRTHFGNWTTNEEWKILTFLPPPSAVIYTSHRNIWLLLHISSRLRRQPTNKRSSKQSPGLYMSLSFKNPSQSSLQTIRRGERERNWVRASSCSTLKVLARPLFKVRYGCASLIHLCTGTEQVSLNLSQQHQPAFWGWHIHIHELRICNGKLWACCYFMGGWVLFESFKLLRIQTTKLAF